MRFRTLLLGCLLIGAAPGPGTGGPNNEVGEDPAQIKQLTRRIQADPRDAEAFFERGRAWAKLGDLNSALTDFGEYIRLKPDDAAGPRLRALVWQRKGDRQRALDDFDRAIRIAPNEAISYRLRGEMRQSGGNLDGALADLNDALRLNPDDAYALSSRAFLYLQRNELDKAIDDYDCVIGRVENKGLAYAGRALCYVRKGDFDRAMSNYDVAVKFAIGGDRPMVYEGRGKCQQHRDEHRKAIADFTLAFEAMGPDDARHRPRIYAGRAFSHWMLGEFAESLDDLNEAVRGVPNNTDYVGNRAMVHKELGHWAEAVADYSETIRLDPNSHRAFQGRAWIWATCPDDNVRDGKRAVESATRGCELSDWKDPADLDILAAAYAERGDFEAAVKWQTEALRVYGDGDDKALSQGAAERLGLYRRHQPYRETRH
ncbi:MAG TPA: tetratricopeptide repeat protein [Pirellulales bacterium]|nr:tetratricopeptide repeat protein [Pirellulales bacterium]